MKIGTATEASYDGVGYYVSVVGCPVTISALGTVIGWAKIAQRKAGLTCFATSAALNGMYCKPTEPATPEQIQKDLIVLLENIGFETDKIAFTESPSVLRRPVPEPIPAVATEQPLNV